MALIDLIAEVKVGFKDQADPERAAPMATYVRDQFEFLGINSPDRRRTTKALIRAAKNAPAAELMEVADHCWAQKHREWQYVGADVLRAGAAHLGADDLTAVRRFITTHAWWDTVDSLAAWTVGPMVTNHPELSATMDDWIDDADIWVARTAILHQLGYKQRTDADRLFSYARRRAADKEFFIRKALGWALRQYARVDAEAVALFVAEYEHELSGLTRREALKHIGRASS